MLFVLVLGAVGNYPESVDSVRPSERRKLQIDCHKKLGGRGAYVCPSQDCIRKAFKFPKRINSLLRVQLATENIAQFKQMLLSEDPKVHERKIKKEKVR